MTHKSRLRKAAEARLLRELPPSLTPLDLQRALHELQVHQIELEMQNEELLQAQVREAELLAQYTELYEFAPAGYLSLDREGIIRQVNLTSVQMLGVERASLVNRRMGVFVAEADRRAFNDFVVRVFAGDAKDVCEVTLPQDESAAIVVHIEGTRSADAQECHAVMMDITARRQAEEMVHAAQVETQNLLLSSDQSRRELLRVAADQRVANEELRKSESRYRELFEASSDAMLLLASDTGQVIDANRMAAHLYGYERDELLTKTNTELSAEPEETGHRTDEARSHPGMVLHIPQRLHRKQDGTVFPVEITARSLIRDERSVLLVACRDITARRQIEDALEFEMVRRRVLFENSPDGILIIDPQTAGFLEFNAAAHQQLGYSREEFARLTIHDLEAMESVDDTRKRIGENMQKGKVDFETLQRTRQGEVRNVHVTTQIVQVRGQPIYQCIWRDITARKQTEAKLLQKMEELSASNVELEHFNRSVVERELRMIELKEEINELCRRLHEAPRYPTSPLETSSIPAATPSDPPTSA